MGRRDLSSCQQMRKVNPRALTMLGEKFPFQIPDCAGALRSQTGRIWFGSRVCESRLISVPLHHFVSGQRVVLR